MDLGLTGETIVVTGATSGIGRAVAERLGAEGAFVMLVARDRQRLQDTRDALPNGPHGIVSADVADPASGARIVAATIETFGQLDGLVACAGFSGSIDPEDLTPADWDAQFRMNVVGPHALLVAATDHLVASPTGGRAVLVSSSSGKRPSLSNMAYSVTKAAELSLSRAWAQHLAGRGVRVNAVAPGPIDSEMWLQPGGLADQAAEASGVSRDEALAAARARVPAGRFGTPEEIADVIVLLASRRAGFTTGSAWSADGGAVATIL